MKNSLYPTISFKWTISRGRNTYGYNICSLYVNGRKQTSCNGGGYDMRGTCLGEWMQNEFQELLQSKLSSEEARSKYYGVHEYKSKIILDGACGIRSMENILADICGYKLEYDYETKNASHYYLEEVNNEKT